MNRALAAYRQFVESGPDDSDAKNFAMHHNAAKAAVTHMTALARLSSLLQKPDGDAPHGDIEHMIRQARADLTNDEGDDDHEKDQF